MIDGSEKRNRQLAFELQNSHVCEKRSNVECVFISDEDRTKLYVHFFKTKITPNINIDAKMS